MNEEEREEMSIDYSYKKEFGEKKEVLEGCSIDYYDNVTRLTHQEEEAGKLNNYEHIVTQ
jgi:hypothetical protein